MTTTSNIIESNIIEANKQYYFEVFQDSKGRPCAKMIRNTPKGRVKIKVLKNYYFGTEAGRNEWVNMEKLFILKKDSDKKKRSEEKKQFTLSVKVEIGDIFVHSWGWEQTNIDYYQVIAKKSKSVVLQQICRNKVYTGDMQGNCTPIKDEFVKDSVPFTKRIKSIKEGEAYVSMEYGWCSLWDGYEDRWSSYA